MVRALGEKLKLALPTAQKLRSIVEIRATGMNSASKSLVARQLSHSDQTAELHYRAAQPSKRAEGFGMVGQLVGMPDPLPTVDPIPATRKCRKFSNKQAALIRSEFSNSTDQRQGILRLRFDRGSASYEPRLKRGETRRNRGLNEAQPRSKRGPTAV